MLNPMASWESSSQDDRESAAAESNSVSTISTVAMMYVFIIYCIPLYTAICSTISKHPITQSFGKNWLPDAAHRMKKSSGAVLERLTSSSN